MKKIIITLFFLIGSVSIFPAIAQTWHELNALGNKYSNEESFDTALIYFKKALRKAENEFGLKDSNYASTLNSIGVVYYRIGQYDTAEIIYSKALEIRKQIFGEKHPLYASTLSDIAQNYKGMGEYNKAESYFIDALKIQMELFGGNNLDYAATLQELGDMYIYSRQFSKADSLLNLSLKIRKNILGEKHPKYIFSLVSVGMLNSYMGHYDDAEKIYIHAVELSEGMSDLKRMDYAILLSNLACVYMFKNQYIEAEQWFLKAIEIQKAIVPSTHPDYIRTINNLGQMYLNWGKYKEAELYLAMATEANRQVLGEKHSNFLKSLNNLATLYYYTGQYKKAEQLFIQAMETTKEVYGEINSDFSSYIGNLAFLYQTMGEFSLAEQYQMKAIKLEEEIVGKEHPDYADLLGNLGQLYMEIGQFDKAEQLFIQSNEIIKNALGDKHTKYGQSLDNLGVLYSKMGLYDRAEPLYTQSFLIDSISYGVDSKQCASDLSNLGYLYYKFRQYDKANSKFIRSLEIRKEQFGEKHPLYANSLCNLAVLYKDIGQYQEAESKLIQAKEIYKEIFGTKHPDYSRTLINLAILFSAMEQNEKANALYVENLDNTNDQVSKAFDFLTEQGKYAFYNTINNNFDSYLSFLTKYYLEKPSVSCYSFNIELIQKGIVLRSMSDFKNTITSSGDSNLINQFKSWLDLKQQLSFLYTQSFDKQKMDSAYIGEIETAADNIEKDLVIKSRPYRDIKASDSYTWSDIKAELKSEEASIEITSFNYFNKGEVTDSILYYALLVRPGYEQPKMILLFEQKQLDSIFMLTLGEDNQKAEQLYANRGTIIEGDKQSLYLASKLYELIWDPIEPFLKGISTVYFSPSGLLHKISFAAIVTPDSMYLSDKYKLIQLGSTREIVRLKKQKDYITLSDSALIFGGINYDQMDMVHDTSKDNILAYRSLTIPNDSSRGANWGYLKGTMLEATYIDNLFRKNKISTEFYCNDKATETLFKSISGRAPQIVHVSTHGFFFPEPEEKRNKSTFVNPGEQTYRFSENPLLRSGLILAGANYVWKGGEQTPGKDDGILTAYEVSNLDLSKTKLVVLSACETGLGDIKGSEGVFGLQRAFKKAGVDYIIMSLWQVPDKESKEFMQQFYTNCFNKQTIREAYTNAQDWMKKKYPDDPYKWAAFVLVE